MLPCAAWSTLTVLQREYNPKGGIIITENGCAVAEEDVDEAVKDIERAVYLKRYLTEVQPRQLRQPLGARGSSTDVYRTCAISPCGCMFHFYHELPECSIRHHGPNETIYQSEANSIRL